MTNRPFFPPPLPPLHVSQHLTHLKAFDLHAEWLTNSCFSALSTHLGCAHISKARLSNAGQNGYAPDLDVLHPEVNLIRLLTLLPLFLLPPPTPHPSSSSLSSSSSFFLLLLLLFFFFFFFLILLLLLLLLLLFLLFSQWRAERPATDVSWACSSMCLQTIRSGRTPCSMNKRKYPLCGSLRITPKAEESPLDLEASAGSKLTGICTTRFE